MSTLTLAAITPGRYLAQGSFGFSETGLRRPLEGSITVELFPEQLVVLGQSRQYGTQHALSFKCVLQRDPQSDSQAEVSLILDRDGTLTGRVALLGPTIELLAYDLQVNSAISARVVPLEKPRIYELSGFLSLHGLSWFPFHLRVVPAGSREALANVVGLERYKQK